MFSRIIDKIVEIYYNMKLNVKYCISHGGAFIRKLRKHNKEWLEYRSRKLLKKRSKSKHKKVRKGYSSRGLSTNHYQFTVPKIFSIEKNPEETIQFYNKILSRINEHKFGAHFFIDSSEVIEVTVDAIMYLIALITDARCNFVYKYSFEGNFPVSLEAKRVYIESGFMAFVHSNGNQRLKPKTDNIQILKGQIVDSPTAAKVCEFVQDNCGLSRIDTMPLYNILVELMGNTKQHAYDAKKEPIANFWYLFAEKKGSVVNFVFLDTGLGIPTTVQKKWGEKIPFINRDSDLIKSALEGEFRTQTRKFYRGKGLPQISECFRSGLLKNIFVYSGRGCCTLYNNNQLNYETKELKNKIFGTLFCWQISKCKEENKCLK